MLLSPACHRAAANALSSVAMRPLSLGACQSCLLRGGSLRGSWPEQNQRSLPPQILALGSAGEQSHVPLQR